MNFSHQKPNLFQLATKELSQDSFFAWLLQWANADCILYNSELNETARDFIRLLIGQVPNYEIIKVNAGRQWHNIDIWAEVNDEYFLGIEDKTNTAEHSEQLDRYKIIAAEQYKNKPHKLVFIYLKTGNESLSTLKKVEEKGYVVIDRKAILNILTKRKIKNEIINDFIDYLTLIENLSSSYAKFEKLTSDWKAAEGFYLKLQSLIPEWSDWRYVSNPAGGFMGFWYHWTGTVDFSLYIQIENLVEHGIIRVVIKISDWEPSLNTLNTTLLDLQPYANKYGLVLCKPEKYRTGETSTLAVVKNPFTIDDLGNLDIDNFIATLKNIENVLDDYQMDQSTQLSDNL